MISRLAAFFFKSQRSLAGNKTRSDWSSSTTSCSLKSVIVTTWFIFSVIMKAESIMWCNKTFIKDKKLYIILFLSSAAGKCSGSLLNNRSGVPTDKWEPWKGHKGTWKRHLQRPASLRNGWTGRTRSRQSARVTVIVTDTEDGNIEEEEEHTTLDTKSWGCGRRRSRWTWSSDRGSSRDLCSLELPGSSKDRLHGQSGILVYF